MLDPTESNEQQITELAMIDTHKTRALYNDNNTDVNRQV